MLTKDSHGRGRLGGIEWRFTLTRPEPQVPHCLWQRPQGREIA